MTKRTRPEVYAAIAKLRAETPCARCGGHPIEWHGEHHLTSPLRRISKMVSAGYKLADVLAEIEVCQPLCRSCHMAIDGRAAALLKRSHELEHWRFANHRPLHGEHNGNAKLTRQNVCLIRWRTVCGESTRTLSQEFHVSPEQIRNIVRGKAWRHEAEYSLAEVKETIGQWQRAAEWLESAPVFEE